MTCKNCGWNLKNDWKYCPNCSKKVYKKKDIIINSTIILIILFFIVMPIIKHIIPKNEKYIEIYLEKTYKENFSKVSLIKSVENQDSDISCDGTTFATIKGEGSTKYFKVYSNKNDIEFVAYYDTSDKLEEIFDSYKESLKKRKTLLEAYKIINKYLYTNDYNIKLTGVIAGVNNKMSIFSEADLKYILSKYDETKSHLNDIEIYVNDSLEEFSTNNYENIIKLNDELLRLQDNMEYDFSTTIIPNSTSKIILYKYEDKVQIIDKNGHITDFDDAINKFAENQFLGGD